MKLHYLLLSLIVWSFSSIGAMEQRVLRQDKTSEKVESNVRAAFTNQLEVFCNDPSRENFRSVIECADIEAQTEKNLSDYEPSENDYSEIVELLLAKAAKIEAAQTEEDVIAEQERAIVWAKTFLERQDRKSSSFKGGAITGMVLGGIFFVAYFLAEYNIEIRV